MCYWTVHLECTKNSLFILTVPSFFRNGAHLGSIVITKIKMCLNLIPQCVCSIIQCNLRHISIMKHLHQSATLQLTITAESDIAVHVDVYYFLQLDGSASTQPTSTARRQSHRVALYQNQRYEPSQFIY